MNSILFEISLILVLLVANGVFAMTEIAIVSSRKGLLQTWVEKGNAGAAKALKLAESPNRFLSTVQIGITLVGILAGALGSGSIAGRLSEWISLVVFLEPYSKQMAFIIVISVLTYLSLVIGELVPKRLAMKLPEVIASNMAAPMAWLSSAAAPVVTLLSWSTAGVLRLFGVRDTEEARMSREELTVLLREGMVTGSINHKESRMMEKVFGFEKQEAYDIMIPRKRIVWIDRDAPHEEVFPLILESVQTVFPVYHRERDNVVGIITIKDLYARVAAGSAVVISEIMRPPLFVPETQKASLILETFRTTGQRVAFVMNEFGSVVGMVTLIDLMETIVGEVPSREEQMMRSIQQRTDGSWLIDGFCEVQVLPDHLEGFQVPDGTGDEYRTVSGWFAHELGRMPVEPDQLVAGEWAFEIIDMDDSRIDKVLASRQDVAAG